MRIVFLGIFFCSILMNWGDNQSTKTVPEATTIVVNDTLYYIFLGHTYQWGTLKGDRVDFRVEALDYNNYDGIWLGGDICSETLQRYTTMEYVVNLFGLTDPNNHFALGNHDHRNYNIEWYHELTGKNDYYAHHQNGITILNLNTNLSPANCEHLDKQYQLIENVCDTIQSSSHLILLMHHNLYHNVPGVPQGEAFSHRGPEHYNVNCSSADARFYNTVYPLLVDVQNRGIQVICIAGDAGWGGNTGAFPSDDNVHFMASGINATFYLPDTSSFNYHSGEDRVLVFKHLPDEEQLEWEFQNLDSLYSNR